MSSTPPTEALLWTTRETAKALSVCEKTLWSLARSGKLRPVKIGRAVRYDRRDVERFVEASKTTGGGSP